MENEKPEYGIYLQSYESGGNVLTVMVGDGKTRMIDLLMTNKTAGIGLDYGSSFDDWEEAVRKETSEPKLQILFEKPEAIDAMIETLQRAKKELDQAV